MAYRRRLFFDTGLSTRHRFNCRRSNFAHGDNAFSCRHAAVCIARVRASRFAFIRRTRLNCDARKSADRMVEQNFCAGADRIRGDRFHYYNDAFGGGRGATRDRKPAFTSLPRRPHDGDHHWASGLAGNRFHQRFCGGAGVGGGHCSALFVAQCHCAGARLHGNFQPS